MAESSLSSAPKSSGRFTRAKILVPVAIVVIAVGAFLVLRSLTQGASTTQAAQMPVSPAIEQRWGVRVKMVGSTADGGMVDFRFVVVDPDKALAMLQDQNNLPVLVAEDSGKLVNSAALMTFQHTLNPGGTYFLLYRNTQGAIKHGTPVTVKFGDLTLEHVIAQ